MLGSFGAMVQSVSTGIILNDEMDDFSAPDFTSYYDIPPSPNNYIEPKKCPLSSMVPSIFVDGNGDVQLITGAAGGTKITTATALVCTVRIIVFCCGIHRGIYVMERTKTLFWKFFFRRMQIGTVFQNLFS
jgi:gamma-glutamyltranspeptidase